jgi:hypothetical protein
MVLVARAVQNCWVRKVPNISWCAGRLKLPIQCVQLGLGLECLHCRFQHLFLNVVDNPAQRVKPAGTRASSPRLAPLCLPTRLHCALMQHCSLISGLLCGSEDEVCWTCPLASAPTPSVWCTLHELQPSSMVLVLVTACTGVDEMRWRQAMASAGGPDNPDRCVTCMQHMLVLEVGSAVFWFNSTQYQTSTMKREEHCAVQVVCSASYPTLAVSISVLGTSCLVHLNSEGAACDCCLLTSFKE